VKYSIIIPTFNRSETLKGCLRTLLKQDISSGDYEIIVVDDGSTDNTSQIVEDIRKNSQENAGCAVARNTGIKNANGDILFFTDDDCIVPENWMSKILKGFEEYPEASGVGGWYAVSQSELESNKYSFMIEALTREYRGDYRNFSQLSNAVNGSMCGNTANVAYKREVFEKVGLFDDYTKKTAKIDWELKYRIEHAGLKLLYIPLVIEHQKKVTCKEFFNRAFRYGFADYYFSLKFSSKPKKPTILEIIKRVGNLKSSEPKVSSFLYFKYLFLSLLGWHYASYKKIRPRGVIGLDPLVTRASSLTLLDGHTESMRAILSEEYSSGSSYARGRKEVWDLLEGVYQVPVISIVVPFYNRENFVTRQFIESFNSLQGDDSAVEIIFVDDGSTDLTRERLEDACSKLRFKAKVISHSGNLGPSAARNTGIDNAQGEYIFFADSDVLVQKYWLNMLLLPFFVEENIGYVSGHQINLVPITPFDVWRNSYIPKHGLVIGNTVSLHMDTSNLCIKKSRLKERGVLYFNLDLGKPSTFGFIGCEDIDYGFSIKFSGLYGAYVQYPVHNQRSLSFKDFLGMFLSRYEGIIITKERHKKLRLLTHTWFHTPNRYGFLYQFIVFFQRKNKKNNLIEVLFSYVHVSDRDFWLYRLVKAMHSVLP
jgi:glycosyltransferase involved in cell wall biosynthesis